MKVCFDAAYLLRNKKVFVSNRDISKNSLLSFRTFLYWTLLGFCHAFVFFFGSYILMGEDTTLMGNGQVRPWVMYCMVMFYCRIPRKQISCHKDFPNHVGTAEQQKCVCLSTYVHVYAALLLLIDLVSYRPTPSLNFALLFNSSFCHFV